MRNRKELELNLEVLRVEFAEALVNGDTKVQEEKAKEILRLELVLKEESIYSKIESIKEDFNTEIELIVDDEEALRQESLVRSFDKKMCKIIEEKANTSRSMATQKQVQAILAGMRDRIGTDTPEKLANDLSKLNYNQASSIIRLLKGISFYDQRKQVTMALKELRERDNYSEILAEVYNNIYKKEWFDLNNEILRMSNELVEPTDAQVRAITNLARYIETRETLLLEFNIDVDLFEQRPEDKLYYVFNWNGLYDEVKKKFNKQSASNFLMTYNHINNFYEGNKLDKEQVNHLRGLYMQLGDYDCTKLTYLSAITKQHYDVIVGQLESQLRLNKIAQNDSNKKYREAMRVTASRTKEVRSIKLKKEQEECKELVNFVHDIYSCIGQSIPSEMNAILPYFIQRGETIYAGVEQCHIKEFRNMVFEQRDVIKDVYPAYNWGAKVLDQPMHILELLGVNNIM